MTVPLDATPTEQLAHLSRLKRSVVGTQAAKAAALQAGGVNSLVALLQPRPEADIEASLAVNSEAANVLAALSIPTIDAVSTLLTAHAYQAVCKSLPLAASLGRTDEQSLASRYKVIESHLRALKALYTDLVKVVGPRQWGTDVIGASIDIAERQDAESMWKPEDSRKVGASKGKGKGKGREDETMSAADDHAALANLLLQARVALDEVFHMETETTAPSVGSSSIASLPSTRHSRSPVLDTLLDLLIRSSEDDRYPATPSVPQRMRIAESVCNFFSGTVRWPPHRRAVTSGEKGKEAMSALRRLANKGTDKVREAALNAITALIRDSGDSMLTLLNLGQGETLRTRLLPFTSLCQSPVPPVRLAAATLCAVLGKLLYPPPALHIPDGELGTSATNVLLSLIEQEPALRARAAFAFAYLVADELMLQKRALAARCFQIFKTVLDQPLLLDQPYPTPAALEEDGRMREGILLCIASMTAISEEQRRLMLSAQLLPSVLSSLSHPFSTVRAAGCHCIRALSRSVNVLRTDLVESHAEGPLVALLREDENEVVKVTAMAVVANLLLDFSPMRSVLVDAGCVPRVCQLIVRSSNEALRLNAMWAIKNATYQSNADFKRSVLACLTWDDLASLLSSPSPFPIVEQALGILRNITCVTNNEAITGLGRDEMGEERLLGLLEEWVAGGSAAGGAKEGGEVVVLAIYCLNNIATAHEAAQLAIASRTSLLRHVLGYLDSRSLQLRVASLWLLHNLVYRRSLSSSSSLAARRPHEILDKLRAMGLEAKLRMLERDPELDVRERVRDLREMLG
ncbi:armadillo repeat containing protein [Rhodotorula toruloides]|uniref:Armadillo repeat containing protein n=1 Tax=Rhodotorula toruloides TaxID=5286 RepID=A0A511KFL4_RHOTO|nr:armadillo repeat containing protein [Rhodotorula toruloides]